VHSCVTASLASAGGAVLFVADARHRLPNVEIAWHAGTYLRLNSRKVLALRDVEIVVGEVANA
jgi:hypothetical protein